MRGDKLLWAVALGGALGALARFGVSMAALATLADWAMAGTLIANVAGSLAIGFVAAWAVQRPVAPWLEALLVTGFCGGFTTFSAFSLETVTLIVGGDWGSAGVYVAVSVVLWLAAVWAGWAAGERFFAPTAGG